jgi:CRISPR type III-B/RAMP module-associated protein Cmr3
MNTILLRPSDVLFFRDGRPMTGSLAGHGAAWPLPNVVSNAFHAALHRAGLEGAHAHDHRDIDGNRAKIDSRKYGSLVTAGPYPVLRSAADDQQKRSDAGTWFFPRPLDLLDGSLSPSLLPTEALKSVDSNLPKPLKYPVASTQPPSKESAAKPWLSHNAYQRYLHGNDSGLTPTDAVSDSAIFDIEQTIGIGINPYRQAQDGQNFYSAHYLRLRDSWRLGVLAQTSDKINGSPDNRQDLIRKLLAADGSIIVGGQQRLCSAINIDPRPPIPLPLGRSSGFKSNAGSTARHLVKWVLLSPAIWPRIEADHTRGILAHPGGWLPNWITPKARTFEGNQVGEGAVLLLDGPGRDKARRRHIQPGQPIRARLVGALIPKPVPVTGYALPSEDSARAEGGAKSSHLAVPAGAVYYFEAHDEAEAIKLAAALNWHGGDSNATSLQNRRSTLLGEKGFGLGVCGTWNFHNVSGRPNP